MLPESEPAGAPSLWWRAAGGQNGFNKEQIQVSPVYRDYFLYTGTVTLNNGNSKASCLRLHGTDLLIDHACLSSCRSRVGTFHSKCENGASVPGKVMGGQGGGNIRHRHHQSLPSADLPPVFMFSRGSQICSVLKNISSSWRIWGVYSDKQSLKLIIFLTHSDVSQSLVWFQFIVRQSN